MDMRTIIYRLIKQKMTNRDTVHDEFFNTQTYSSDFPGKSQHADSNDVVLVEIPLQDYGRIAGMKKKLRANFGIDIRCSIIPVDSNSSNDFDSVILILSGGNSEKRRSAEEYIRNKQKISMIIPNILPSVLAEVSVRKDYTRLDQLRTKWRNGKMSVAISGTTKVCREIETALLEAMAKKSDPSVPAY